MSIRLRPMDDTDLKYLYKSPVLSAKSITDPEEGGTPDKFKISKAKAHVRSYIDLKVPCINSVLCGSRYGMASKLLGVDSDQVEGLAKFDLCIEASSGEVIQTVGLEGTSEDYLFNGEALTVLISRLMPTREAAIEISNVIVNTVGKDCPFEVVPSGGEYRVLGNWGLILGGVPNKDFCEAKLRETVVNGIKNGKLSRALMLVNLLSSLGSDEAVRQYLKKALVLRALTILPINLRPKLGNKEHPLTNAYVRLYNNNNNYSMYAGGPVEDFKEYYKTVFSLVNTITCTNHYELGDIVSIDKDLRQVRPLLETMKGKHGSIREHMLKKRQDYSGRSSVIVDPFLPINCLGIPKSTIPKLYRKFVMEYCKFAPESVMSNLHNTDFDEYIMEELIKQKVIDDVPILMGRNPTLHRHGIQGFHVVPVDGRAIRVSPLVCPAFNMDFDGDTAHDEIPLSPEASREVRNLIMTDKNILLPKTGESTICPRMDIVYGLYMCTRACYAVTSPVANYENADALKEAIYNQDIQVWDTVSLAGYRTDIAGKLAFESCFPKAVISSMPPTPEITSKNIPKYIARIQYSVTESFDRTINSLVELGFKVAYLCSMSVSLLKPLHSETNAAQAFDTAYAEFHEKMKPINDLNDFGFYDAETYGVEYSNYLRTVDKTLADGVFDKIGENMFSLMAKSGARGNTSNLVQMFGSKGRIQKSESELFNVTIEHGLYHQLTPIEHVIAAFGARRGQIAKSIKTADTGYLSRKLAHADSPLIITEADCGTRDGITISKREIVTYLYKENMNAEDKEKAEATATEIMIRFITGRYRAENGVKIGPQEAEALATSKVDAKVKIRSPLKCKNPCCQKCYGNDTSTGKTVAIGHGVGFIAAQSLGEPSTQLTMKEFQKGGTAGAASSPFDRLNAVLCQTDIRREAKEGRYNAYNPIAWAPGKLVLQDYPGMNVLLQIEPEGVPKEVASQYNYGVKRIVPGNVSYKIGQHVELGETLRVASGDCYIQEVNQISGTDRAQLVMVYTLYFLFRSQVDLVPIHLETMVASLTGYMPIVTDLPQLKVGKYYTSHQLAVIGADYRNTEFISNIRGVGSAITNNPNFMEALIMEDQRHVLSDAVLNCAYDLGDAPLVQFALGQQVKLGTGYNPNFMEDR